MKLKTKKRIMVIAIMLLFIVMTVSARGEAEKPKAVAEIEYASLRTEDSDMMKVMHDLFFDLSGIRVRFEPIKNVEYDAILNSSLEAGVGPDIMYVRAYDRGRGLYDNGHLLDLSGKIGGLLKKLPTSVVDVWTTEDGVVYGMPNAGVTHGVFYNKDIFDKYNLSEPETWDEFLRVADVLKRNGEVVFAQGLKDAWTLETGVYTNLGPNFFGGHKNELKLVSGEMRFTDKPFVDSLRAMNQLVPYFPAGYKGIGYVDMQQMFVNEQAAMFIGGSWELGVFLDMGLDFELGWFAPPVVNKGDTLQYCFHPDNAIGINIDSKNIDEALEYLEWIGSDEYAQMLMDNLPGWYSFVPGDFEIENPIARKMIEAVDGAETMGRLGWYKLGSQEPSFKTTIQEALFMMMAGEMTPEQAAQFTHDALSRWYEPFM